MTSLLLTSLNFSFSLCLLCLAGYQDLSVFLTSSSLFSPGLIQTMVVLDILRTQDTIFCVQSPSLPFFIQLQGFFPRCKLNCNLPGRTFEWLLPLPWKEGFSSFACHSNIFNHTPLSLYPFTNLQLILLTLPSYQDGLSICITLYFAYFHGVFQKSCCSSKPLLKFCFFHRPLPESELISDTQSI